MPPFRRTPLLVALLTAATLAAACTSDEPQPTATPSPSPSLTSEATQSPTASPTPPPTPPPLPDVRNATVLLPGLRVRTAPDGPDLGRIPEGERVIVVGRYLTPDDPRSVWLGVQYLGWVHYSPENIELDRNVEALPLIEHPDLRLSTRLPLNEPRTGIAVIDPVLEAVLTYEIDTLASLVQLHQHPCTNAPDSGASPTCPEGVPTGTPVETFDVGLCGDQRELAAQLPQFLADFFDPNQGRSDELSPLMLHTVFRLDRHAGGYWAFFAPSPNSPMPVGLLITQDGAIAAIGYGCDDPATTPLPTHLPLLNAYLPAPLSPPLTITAPPPTDTPEVDAIFAAVQTGDIDALVAMAAPFEVECRPDDRPGYDPTCSDLGLAPGATYQAISTGGCDGSAQRADNLPEFFAGLVRPQSRYTAPFGAYLVDEKWGGGGAVVMFANPDDEPIRGTRYVHLSGGGISGLFGSCGSPMPDGAAVARWLVHPTDLGYDLRQLPPVRPYDSARFYEAFSVAGIDVGSPLDPVTLPWLTVDSVTLSGVRRDVGESASVALFDLRNAAAATEVHNLVSGQLPEPLHPGARAIWTTDRTLIILWNRMPHWDIEDILIEEFGQPLLLEAKQDPAGARPSEGSPFSGKDLVLALRAYDIPSAPGHTGVALCGKEQQCGVGISYGTFLLWTYETTELRAAEWDLAPDGRATALVGTPPGGPTYGNANLVLLHSGPLDLTAERVIGVLLSLGNRLPGSPFSGPELADTLAERGLKYTLQDQEMTCVGAGAVGDVYVDPSGTSFALWVYPTSGALGEDWDRSAEPPPSTKLNHCPLGSGVASWSANLLLVFLEPHVWDANAQRRDLVIETFQTLVPAPPTAPSIPSIE